MTRPAVTRAVSARRTIRDYVLPTHRVKAALGIPDGGEIIQVSLQMSDKHETFVVVTTEEVRTP